MPYERKGKCVYKKTGEKVGCSNSIEKAKSYLKALYAQELKEGLIPTKQEVLDSPEFQEIRRGMYNSKEEFYKRYGDEAEKTLTGTAFDKAKKKIIEKRRKELLDKSTKKEKLNEVDTADFKDKVKSIIKAVYTEKSEENPSEKDTLTPDLPIDNYIEKFPILTKFPDLKQILTDLMTNQYEMFVGDIWWVAPRPTTFKIILNNDQSFYIIYGERSWIAQVEGKKYYLLNVSDEENAAESISRVLKYSTSSPEKKEVEVEPETPEIKAPETPEEAPEETPET
jgi:hypothetical protein